MNLSQLQDATCIVRMLMTNVLLYLAVNLAGMYTKYLTDRGQRQAFLETHRSTETRQRTQNENNRQEKLLLSGEKKISSHPIFSKSYPSNDFNINLKHLGRKLENVSEINMFK